MLKFDSDEDALFIGLEAEGPMKGMPTLFIVGNPSLDVVESGLQRLQEAYKNEHYGIYLGAGSRIFHSLQPSRLKHLLQKTDKYFARLAIESAIADLVDVYKETVVLATNSSKRFCFDWIIPIVFGSDFVLSAATLSAFIAINKKSKTCYITQFNVNFYGKVYIPNTVLAIAPLATMSFADYDNNVGEFQTDKLLWSSKQKGI